MQKLNLRGTKFQKIQYSGARSHKLQPVRLFGMSKSLPQNVPARRYSKMVQNTSNVVVNGPNRGC